MQIQYAYHHEIRQQSLQNLNALKLLQTCSMLFFFLYKASMKSTSCSHMFSRYPNFLVAMPMLKGILQDSSFKILFQKFLSIQHCHFQEVLALIFIISTIHLQHQGHLHLPKFLFCAMSVLQFLTFPEYSNNPSIIGDVFEKNASIHQIHWGYWHK